MSLTPAFWILRPERRHRQPVRGLVHRHDGEAPEQEHERASPIRCETRTASVAPDHEVDEGGEARRRSAGDRGTGPAA